MLLAAVVALFAVLVFCELWLLAQATVAAALNSFTLLCPRCLRWVALGLRGVGCAHSRLQTVIVAAAVVVVVAALLNCYNFRSRFSCGIRN